MIKVTFPDKSVRDYELKKAPEVPLICQTA
jgi:hypothetical protein